MAKMYLVLCSVFKLQFGIQGAWAQCSVPAVETFNALGQVGVRVTMTCRTLVHFYFWKWKVPGKFQLLYQRLGSLKNITYLIGVLYSYEQNCSDTWNLYVSVPQYLILIRIYLINCIVSTKKRFPSLFHLCCQICVRANLLNAFLQKIWYTLVVLFSITTRIKKNSGFSLWLPPSFFWSKTSKLFNTKWTVSGIESKRFQWLLNTCHLLLGHLPQKIENMGSNTLGDILPVSVYKL